MAIKNRKTKYITFNVLYGLQQYQQQAKTKTHIEEAWNSSCTKNVFVVNVKNVFSNTKHTVGPVYPYCME